MKAIPCITFTRTVHTNCLSRGFLTAFSKVALPLPEGSAVTTSAGGNVLLLVSLLPVLLIRMDCSRYLNVLRNALLKLGQIIRARMTHDENFTTIEFQVQLSIYRRESEVRESGHIRLRLDS